ncbi:MAG: amidase [Chloroflexi bacterium]|nr:MAG: amidase [Chloroflexota bacterium]
MDADDLCYLSAIELLAKYRGGDVSPVEVTDAVLERIARLDPQINAFVTLTAERARADALAAEAAYRSGDAVGALSGVPISIKDLTPTKGIPTKMGSLLYSDNVPDFDPPFVERVYAAGAVMLGKTTTPEFGWKGESSNRVNGPTHNPWKHGLTAGGSSGGAAAAVAAGFGPLAQGSDGAGSIRIPAGFCGVFGLKPSFGLVTYYPPSPMEVLSHLGPLTRTVRDAALLLNVTVGQDPRDRNSFDTGIDYLAACDGDAAGLRVAWSSDLGYAPVDPEVRAITTAAVHRLSDLGWHVEEAHPDADDPWDIVDTLWAAGQANRHRENFAQVRDRIDPGRIPIIERGMSLRAVDVMDALARRHDYYDRVRVFMERYDLFVTPQLPVTAFPVGHDHPGTVDGHPTTYLGWTAFTYPFNLTGHPAATIPVGFASNGLPVCLQFVGKWRADATVLRAAAAFEAAFPWADKRPPLG